MQILMERIKAICKERGLSLRAIEMGTGITENTISRWGSSPPSIDKVKKVADFLGVTIDDLLRDSPDTPGE